MFNDLKANKHNTQNGKATSFKSSHLLLHMLCQKQPLDTQHGSHPLRLSLQNHFKVNKSLNSFFFLVYGTVWLIFPNQFVKPQEMVRMCHFILLIKILYIAVTSTGGFNFFLLIIDWTCNLYRNCAVLQVWNLCWWDGKMTCYRNPDYSPHNIHIHKFSLLCNIPDVS